MLLINEAQLGLSMGRSAMHEFTQIQIEILELAAETEVGPVVPGEVLAEPTLSQLLRSGLLHCVYRRVEITDLGRAFLALRKQDQSRVIDTLGPCPHSHQVRRAA